MNDFGDFQAASRMRDTIERIAEQVVNRERPPHRLGRVVRTNVNKQIAWVQLTGDDPDNLVQVRFAMNMIPTKVQDSWGDDCDIVRVAGKAGSYYVVDYLRGAPRSAGSSDGGGGEVGLEVKIFNFIVPSSLWVCVHDFGQAPTSVVTVIDSGEEILGNVLHVSDSTTEVHWFYDTVGLARVSK